MKIKMNTTAFDKVGRKNLMKGTVIDLGKERNEAAVNNKLAVWVDSRSFKEERAMEDLAKPSEKKEGTPKKTTSSVKGKKIETK